MLTSAGIHATLIHIHMLSSWLFDCLLGCAIQTTCHISARRRRKTSPHITAVAAINGILGGDELAATSGVHGQNDLTLENEINFNFFRTWVGRNRDHFTSSWYKPALSTYLFRKGAASKYVLHAMEHSGAESQQKLRSQLFYME